MNSFDPSPGEPLRSQESSKITAGEVNYISNSLGYAAIWESKDGNMALAMADFKIIVQKYGGR